MFGTVVRGGFTMSSKRVQKRTSKKARIRRTKLILRGTLLTVCIIALLAICSSAILSKATTSDDEKVYYKYYTQIEIQKGDSLWTLAGEYMENGPYESRKEYMEEVAELNQLSNTTIFEGQCLIVPYYDDTYK